jgi:hypothetical protein
MDVRVAHCATSSVKPLRSVDPLRDNADRDGYARSIR